MSVWDLIERKLSQIPVSIWLTEAELYAVKEASYGKVLAWAIIESAPVKGLSPQEVNIIRQHPAGAKAKSKMGNTGEVMMMEPAAWKQVRDELEANREYYNMMVLHDKSIDDLIGKIDNSLQLSMGNKYAPKSRPEPDLSGNPADKTHVTYDPEKHKPSYEPLAKVKLAKSPFSSKVRKQDADQMAGATQVKTTVQDPKQQQQTADMEDPNHWFDEP